MSRVSLFLHIVAKNAKSENVDVNLSHSYCIITLFAFGPCTGLRRHSNVADENDATPEDMEVVENRGGEDGRTLRR